jgi:hypothetical protein
VQFDDSLQQLLAAWAKHYSLSLQQTLYVMRPSHTEKS